MKTNIYSAYGDNPLLKTVNYGVGDIVRLKSYGDVYPSYDGAYNVFGFDMCKKDRFYTYPESRINMYHVVGFLLHDYATHKHDEDYILVAVTNGYEDLIVSIHAVEPIRYYNRMNKGKTDSVVISKVRQAAHHGTEVKTQTSQDS